MGKPADPTSGLNLLGARNYDPVTGRFLSVDPVFESDDPNQMGGYGYAAGNPVSGSDPDGLAWYSDWGGAVGSFFCGVGDSFVGDPWQWSVNKLSDGWNGFASIANGDNQWFNGWTGYSNETPFQLGHTGYVDDDPLANLFGVDTGSTSTTPSACSRFSTATGRRKSSLRRSPAAPADTESLIRPARPSQPCPPPLPLGEVPTP